MSCPPNRWYFQEFCEHWSMSCTVYRKHPSFTHTSLMEVRRQVWFILNHQLECCEQICMSSLNRTREGCTMAQSRLLSMILGHLQYWRVFKMHHWFISDGCFSLYLSCLTNLVCIVVELAWGGSATNGATPSSQCSPSPVVMSMSRVPIV